MSRYLEHHILEDAEGLTTLCLAEPLQNTERYVPEPGSKLLYAFYAESHYEAMMIYYEFMGWGLYTTEFEADKLPYTETKL